MEFLGDDLITVLTFLLPGFLAAWVFHGLTPFPKPPQLERVIQALILTIFVQVGVNTVAWGAMLVGDWKSLGDWTEGVRLGWSVALALLLGLFLARWASRDTIHSRLREFNFTSLTSYPSEWFFEFARSQCYVVLHLKGCMAGRNNGRALRTRVSSRWRKRSG